MIHKILICDVCNQPDVELIKKRLNENNIEYQIEIGCLNMCAVGEKFQFALVDGQVIMKNDQKELIEEILNKIV